jgi:hypothetical protein
MTEMNIFYDKLYLVLDTELIEKINKLIGGDDSGTVSRVQRYYILREIRAQMLKYLSDNPNAYISEKELPYIDMPVSSAPVYINNKQRPAESFEEVQLNYPFVEKGDKPNTYKGLPVYGSSQG